MTYAEKEKIWGERGNTKGKYTSRPEVHGPWCSDDRNGYDNWNITQAFHQTYIETNTQNDPKLPKMTLDTPESQNHPIDVFLIPLKSHPSVNSTIPPGKKRSWEFGLGMCLNRVCWLAKRQSADYLHVSGHQMAKSFFISGIHTATLMHLLASHSWVTGHFDRSALNDHEIKLEHYKVKGAPF